MKSIIAIAFLVSTIIMSSSQSASAQSRPLRHVVSFKFTADATREQVDELIKDFSDLKNKIPQIQAFEWGVNNSPEGFNKGLTHCFILTFASEQDRDIYLPHPAHKAFGTKHGPIIADGFVVDFYAKEE